MVTSKGCKSTLNRPIQLLYPLKVASPINNAHQNKKLNDIWSNESDKRRNDSGNSNDVTGSEANVATNDSEN